MSANYRVADRYGRFVVETQLVHPNGIPCWFVVADCDEPRPEEQACGYEPEEWAKRIARLLNAEARVLRALEAAQQFIENGVEVGAIRMPDEGTPDPAHKTLPAIRRALAVLSGNPAKEDVDGLPF